MKTHELKTWPAYYNDVLTLDKTFELRKNDRGFRVGDKLILKEYLPITKQFTGRYCIRYVKYLLNASGGFGLKKGHVIFSLNVTPVITLP